MRARPRPPRLPPVLQTNGVSIYHHQHDDEATGIGGEYMVSAVRGMRALPSARHSSRLGSSLLLPASPLLF